MLRVRHTQKSKTVKLPYPLASPPFRFALSHQEYLRLASLKPWEAQGFCSLGQRRLTRVNNHEMVGKDDRHKHCISGVHRGPWYLGAF